MRRTRVAMFRTSVVTTLIVLGAATIAPTRLVATAAPVAPTQSELPDAAEIIARHVEAVGGRAAIEGHSSSRATGALEVVGQGLTGSITVYASAPDKTLVVINFDAMGLESRTGYDGEVGWTTDPMTGPRLLQGGELQQLVDESNFYADLHAPERFETMETVERTEFAGKPAYKVRLVYNSGRESFEYFDVESGLMAGTEGVQESLMGSLNVVTVIEDYRSFGDLMVPTRILQELGPGQQVSVTLTEIAFDDVDPSMYELPAEIKALVGS